MKKLDKLKHQRYDITMKIIDLESRLKTLSTTELKTLEILRKKETNLNEKIDKI